MNVDLSFTDVTTGVIVAGRLVTLERTTAEWRRVCEDLDRLASRLGVPLVIAVGQYLASFEDDEEIIASAVVGLLVASNDAPEPIEIDADLLRSALPRARELPWAEIVTLIGPQIDPPDETDHVYVTATGPQAGAHVTLGVRGSAASPHPGLEHVAGKDMDQNRIDDGIWGVKIAYVGDWEYSAIDGAIAKHDENLARLGGAAPNARYWLMACYD